MRILLIGAQGSGKSTQAKLLAEYLNAPFVSTGDIFRKLSQEAFGFGQTIKKIMDEGKLVDDQTTCKIVQDRLSQTDCNQGFVLDGYPRNLEQVKIFDPKFDKVFYLDVSEEAVIERLTKRGRADDTPESIKTRLELYYQQTKPLLNYYRDLGILTEVDGVGSVEDIHQRIKDSLKK